MKIFNTRTKSLETFIPEKPGRVGMYSCGPTVYDHAHIGNLASFIFADTLRRVLNASNYEVTHVMNFTDVDDKIIARSQRDYSDEEPIAALQKLTRNFENIFLDDMRSIGNDTEAVTFLRATESLDTMRSQIAKLHKEGIAYIADDGVYFDIAEYKKTRIYGQLSNITIDNTKARINNDEYDKESAQDFSLWKCRKEGEPAWEFELDGHNLLGRPGWHIECSAMSVSKLGQPFDIHTGGVDLIFPHHENEIAQSTAGDQPEVYANFFCHYEHLLVEGKKMSKSLHNFFTLVDVIEKGYDPLAFRLLTLQGHYRKQTNFTWESLDAASNRLNGLRAMAELRWQPTNRETSIDFEGAENQILSALQEDINTPQALSALSQIEDLTASGVGTGQQQSLQHFLGFLDRIFGLQLIATTPDITAEQLHTIQRREDARTRKDFSTSDKLRNSLAEQNLEVSDTPSGSIWHRT